MKTKRLLDLSASEFTSLTKLELKQSILAAEGRTIMAENVPSRRPFLYDVSNAEVERAAGADLILFNALDLFNIEIQGIPDEIKGEDQIKWIKKAIGRPIGLNLEPVDTTAKMAEMRTEISIGRIVSPKSLQYANRLGFDFICLTGNPGTGVSNDSLLSAIKLAKEYFNGLIIAGKMHGAGVDEDVMNLEIAKSFIDAGVDILMTPAPYTVPGFMEEDLRAIVKMVKKHNRNLDIDQRVLIMAANGTSQDSSDYDTIKKIGLSAKACGADIHHIGDSFNGIALPQNIFMLGQAIRGYRHQILMLSKSNYR